MKKLFLCLILLGCGPLKEATSTQKDLVVPEVNKFETQSGSKIILKKVTVFLWKEKMKGADVATVNKLSTRISQLDDEAIALQPEVEALDKLVEAQREMRREQKKLEKEITTQKKAVDAAQKAVDADPSNAELGKKLADEQAKFEQVKSVNQPKIDQIVAALPQMEKDIEIRTAALEEKQKKITEEAGQRLAALQALVDWFETQPSQITLDFERDRVNPSVTVQGWDPNDRLGTRTFTSLVLEQTPQYRAAKMAKRDLEQEQQRQAALIGQLETARADSEKQPENEGLRAIVKGLEDNVSAAETKLQTLAEGLATAESELNSFTISVCGPDTNCAWGAIDPIPGSNIYDAQAGKARFVVRVGRGYSYEFNFLRTNYDDVSKIQMGGDLTRYRHGESPRYGVVKLSDRKN